MTLLLLLAAYFVLVAGCATPLATPPATNATSSTLAPTSSTPVCNAAQTCSGPIVNDTKTNTTVAIVNDTSSPPPVGVVYAAASIQPSSTTTGSAIVTFHTLILPNTTAPTSSPALHVVALAVPWDPTMDQLGNDAVAGVNQALAARNATSPPFLQLDFTGPNETATWSVPQLQQTAGGNFTRTIAILVITPSTGSVAAAGLDGSTAVQWADSVANGVTVGHSWTRVPSVLLPLT